jgi:hypothetical protein
MDEKRKKQDVNDEPKKEEEGRNAELTTSVTDEQARPFFSPEEVKGFRARWDAVQVGFVDDPRQAVEQANGLVEIVMKRLAETFTDERAQLESQWDRRSDVSTEDLRLALRHYRSFFSRLLSV